MSIILRNVHNYTIQNWDLMVDEWHILAYVSVNHLYPLVVCDVHSAEVNQSDLAPTSFRASDLLGLSQRNRGLPPAGSDDRWNIGGKGPPLAQI